MPEKHDAGIVGIKCAVVLSPALTNLPQVAVEDGIRLSSRVELEGLLYQVLGLLQRVGCQGIDDGLDILLISLCMDRAPTWKRESRRQRSNVLTSRVIACSSYTRSEKESRRHYLSMVCALSGPTLTMVMGVPVAFSM